MPPWHRARVAVVLGTCCNRTMHVPPVGAGPTGMESPSGPRGLAAPKGQSLAPLTDLARSPDAITAILRQLSELDFVKLFEFIDRPLPPENAARLEDLLRTSRVAAAEGNVRDALVKLAEFAATDPRRAETLEAEPGLASIQPDVRQLLFRLASAAQMDAESRLGQAKHLLETQGLKELPGLKVKSDIIILIAGRLLEAGGYANCMRSAELSQLMIDLYGRAFNPVPVTLAGAKNIAPGSAHAKPGLWSRWMPRIRRLWLRAPLLILLLAWLAAGLVAGSVSALLRTCWPQIWPGSLVASAFEVWGLGFLALILFGFYARVRNVRW